MKIRLLATDSKIPNLAIMKISTYHKRLGDDVDWYQPMMDFEDTDILPKDLIFYHLEHNNTGKNFIKSRMKI